MADGDDGLSPAAHRFCEREGSRARREPLVRDRLEAELLPEELPGLHRAQKRAREDGVRAHARLAQPCTESTGLLAPLRGEGAELVGTSPRGLAVAYQIESHPERRIAGVPRALDRDSPAMTRPMSGYAIVLASTLLLGTLGMFSRLFYDEGGEPFTLLVLRFVGAGPALLALAVLLGDRLPAWPVVSAGLALGALQLGAAYALFEGFAQAPVGLVVLLFFVYPLIVSVGAALLFGEELGARRVVVLVIGMAGVALTVGVPESADRAGILLGLAAGVCVAGVVLAARHLMVSHALSPVLLSALMFSSPSLVLVPVAAGRGIDLDLSGAAWATAAGAIVVSGVIAISLFYTGVKLVGAGTASLLGIGEPFAAVLLGYAVLGESLSPLQLVGGALIVAAVALLSFQGLRAPAEV